MASTVPPEALAAPAAPRPPACASRGGPSSSRPPPL